MKHPSKEKKTKSFQQKQSFVFTVSYKKDDQTFEFGVVSFPNGDEIQNLGMIFSQIPPNLGVISPQFGG